jgi:hypothetical protein
MKEIRILPAVLHDINEAALWYDREGYPGLGDRFIGAFYACLPRIQQDGEVFRAVYRDFRKMLIRPFPYTIFYRLCADTWIVTLVIHAARRPQLARHLLTERK